MKKVILILSGCIIVVLIYSSFFNDKKTTDKGCQTIKSNKLIEFNIDSIHDIKQDFFSSIFDEVDIVQLESTSNSLVGEITQLKFIDSIIYIFDDKYAKCVFLFTTEGKFINKVGVIGKGPGEYTKPISFCVNSETQDILILDSHLQSIFIYTSSGRFKDEISLKNNYYGRDFTLVDNNIFVDINNFRKDKGGAYLVRKIDKNGADKNYWLDYPKYNKGWNARAYLADRNFFELNSSTSRYYNTFCDTIFTISNNTLSPYIVFNSSNSIRQEDLDKVTRDVFKLTRDLQDKANGKFIGITNYVENKSHIYMKYKGYNSVYNELLYSKKPDGKFSSRLKDDMTGLPSFGFDAFNDSMAIITLPQHKFGISLIISRIVNGEINIPVEYENKIMNLDPNGNPILFCYTFK